MPLKLMVVPVISDNSVAMMDVMVCLTSNFLACLGKLFLSSAIVPGKSRELIFAKEKGLAVGMSAASRDCPIKQGEIK
jgi:hypothetical protein